MTIIEPHIHMYSRTTDEYQAMYAAGIRACVEPSFWLGANRRHAGTFFDYFLLILEFETVRARRFGIDHYAAVSLNPKLDKSYLFLGYIHKATGRADKAEKQFEKAIQCNPDCTEALRELRLLGRGKK